MVSLNVSSPANATYHSAKEAAGLHATWYWFYIHADAQVLILKYQSHEIECHIRTSSCQHLHAPDLVFFEPTLLDLGSCTSTL